MPSRRANRVALVGIDGFSPAWIEKFLDDGSMPNLARIRRSGATVPLRSTLPATTPVAWASIATGCHPSATGIEGFLLHLPGRALDRRVSGAYATRCRREPIWETAALWGKRAYVVKFPLSYPSSAATLRIDGAAGWGGILCLHQACASGVADSARPDGSSRFVPAEEPLPPGSRFAWTGSLEIETLWGGAPVRICCAVIPSSPPELAISPTGDWEDAIVLRRGEWSELVRIDAHGRTGKVDCAVRFKLLHLDASGPGEPSIRMLNGPVHELRQHSHPAGLADFHLQRAGPVEEESEPTLLLEGLVDFDTQLERCRLNSRWLQRLSQSILEAEDWDLFMVHIHIVDWAHHLLEGALDPRHPLHDPNGRAEAVERLRAHYRLADGLVGVIASQVGDCGNMVVLGDHGQDLHHTTIRLNEAFSNEGWLAWAQAEGDAVEWERTSVYAAGNYVYLNRADREPGGIVQPEETDAMVARICAFLDAMIDPRTGVAPFVMIGPKAQFAELGADGAGTGDVIFCLESGYQARNDRGPVFELTQPGREFTSGHDHFSPLDPRIESRLYASGDAFARCGTVARRSVIDVNPTLCAVLGIDPADECQGSPIVEILKRSPAEAAAPRPLDLEPVSCP